MYIAAVYRYSIFKNFAELFRTALSQNNSRKLRLNYVFK